MNAKREPSPESVTTMGDVSATAEKLIRTIGQAHLTWVVTHGGEAPLKVRFATYVALRAMARAFDIKELLVDATDIERLDALADAIDITTQDVSQAIVPVGRA